MSKFDHAVSQSFASCLDPTVLAEYPHSLALNDPPGGYPVVISSFGTSSGFVLPSGSGTVVNDASITGGNLVLTPNAGSKAGIGLYGTPVAVGAGVQVEFTYTSKGGSGADGIAFFVLDASQVSSASAVVPGGYGGGLGYSDDGRAGITGGVLGIGFDTYGNYSAVDHSPQTGTGRSPNSVDIRGAGNAATSGYALLNTTAFAPGIDGTRTAKVTLVPDGTNTLVSVAVSTDGGKTFTTVINSLSVAQALPSSVYYGFSASTGGSTDLHEINAMAVQLLTDPEIGAVSSTDVTTGTNNPSTIAPGDSVTYSYSVVNNGPNGSSQLALTDDAPSNLVGETYTIVDSLGTHTGTGAPDVGNLNLSSGATATVSVSGTVDIHATSGNLSHVITVVPGSSYASSNPAGGTVTANIGGTSSSLFLQNADTASAITGASATVLLASAAVVVDEAGATHTVNADVHETNTALGTLALASGGPLTGTYDATTGDLRFSGTAAQVQAEMRDVEFVNVAHTGSSPLVTQGYTFILTDATTGKQAVETRAATSIASPSASGPVGGSSILDTSSDSPFSGVTVSEPNAVPLTATVTVNAADGDFSAAIASGWSRSASGTLVTYTRTYSASGTVAAAVQAGLQSLSFQPVEHAIAPGSSETDGFSVTVADAAGTGTPVLSGADTVTAVHDLPSVSGAVGGQSVSDETPAAPFATTVVADPDDTSLVVVISEAAGHGDFMPASASGWSRSASGRTVSYTETFAAAPGGGAASAANAAIQALTFQPTAHALPPGGVEQDFFSLAVTDGLGSAAASGTGTVTVTAAHDTPVLTNPTASPDTSDAQAVFPYASATVIDPDDTSITLTATFAGASGDFTSASSSGWNRLSSDGTTTYVRAFGAGNDSASHAQAALQALQFQPTPHAGVPGTSSDETYTATATDGLGASSATPTVVGAVTYFEDGPTVAGPIGGQTITDEQTASPFAATTIEDPDDTILTLNVTVTAATGDFTAASSAAWTRVANPDGSVTYSETFADGTSSAAAAQASLQALTIQPVMHALALGSQETDGFSVQAVDGSGTSMQASGSVTVTPADDGPTLSGTVGGHAVPDTGTDLPFSGVAVSDADRGPLTVTVDISAARGDLTPGSCAGWTRTLEHEGTLSYVRTFDDGTGSAAAAESALRALVLQPVAHAAVPGTTEVDTLSVVVADSDAVSSTTLSGTDTVASSHGTPAVSGTVGGQSIADLDTARPFSAVVVGDTDDIGLTATVTVSAAHGDFTTSSTGNWLRSASAGTVTYTESFEAGTGSAAAAQAALASLVFQPVAHALAPTASEDDAFSLSVVDDQGASAPAVSGSVTVTAVHDAPVVSGGVADQATTAGSTILPFGSVTVVDPDRVGLTASVTVQGGGTGTGDLVAGSTMGWTRTIQDADTVFSRTFAYQPGVDAVAQDTIRSLAFMPELTGTTAFSITVSDTASTPLTSAADTSNSVLASVGGPSVTGGSLDQPTSDTAPLSPYADVAVVDPDTVAARASVTVTGGASTGDDLTAASASGWTRTVQGADIVYTRDFPAGSAEAADIQAAVRTLVLQPAAHVAAPGTQHVVELPLAVSDIYGTSHGDSSVAVTAATDRPVLATTTTTQAIADVETATPFSGLTVSEPDDVPATATVVIADGVDQGDFTDASAAGFTRSVSGKDIVYTLSLAARTDIGTALEDALASLVFQPVKQAPGTSETTAISLGTTFGSLGVGLEVDVAVTSGGSLYPYPDLYARDANPNAVITVTARLPTGTAGHYATLGIGHVGDDPLAYVVSGTAAQVTTALHAVTFVSDVGSTLPASYTAGVAGDGNQAQLVDLGSGDNQLSATNANDTVVGGPGSDTIYGSVTESAVLIGGTGHNVFVSAQGHTTVFSGAAGSVFYGGTLDDVMIQSSGQDTFYGGSGDATVFGGTGRTQVFGDTGDLNFEGFSGAATVQGGSGHNAIYGGTATLTVYGGGSGIYTGGTSGGNLLLSGTGDSTLVGGGNGDEVVAVGSGTDVVAAGSGSETVTGANATGGDLYFGGTGNALIAVGGGQSTVIGGPGTDTVFAGKGSGSLVYYGGTGADFVVGSTFLDTFVVSSGNDTLVGSGGTDSYVLDKGHAGGTVTVEDFKVGTDTVNLFGYALDEVSGALARETVSGGDTTLLFSDGTRMTFVGVRDVSAAIHHGNDVS